MKTYEEKPKKHLSLCPHRSGGERAFIQLGAGLRRWGKTEVVGGTGKQDAREGKKGAY